MSDLTLKTFLYERKVKMLGFEQRAKGKAKTFITAQIQVLDILLRFLNSKQGETDMTKLKLDLDVQVIPLNELEPRQRADNGLSDEILALAKKLEAVRDGALPVKPKGSDYLRPKSIVTKISVLKEKGLLPMNFYAAQRKNNVFLVKQEASKK